MSKLLENKVALVTGAGSGIGREIAYYYAGAGAKVVVSDIDEPGGIQTVAHIVERQGRAIFVRADTSKPADSEALVHTAVSEFGALHIATNNAGIGGSMAPVGEYPIDDWERVIAINLSGVFYGMRYQIPAMLEAGAGAIVNMASILGTQGYANSAAYVAAKHGMVGLTKSTAIEYARHGIRVNSVGPGFIDTPLLSKVEPAALAHIAGLHPVGRLGRSDEVAALTLFLLSDEASFITGSYHLVDGGYSAQ